MKPLESKEERLKDFIHSIILCTWDCTNLDVEPPTTEKGMTIDETVEAKLPQLKKLIEAELKAQRSSLIKEMKNTANNLKLNVGEGEWKEGWNTAVFTIREDFDILAKILEN